VDAGASTERSVASGGKRIRDLYHNGTVRRIARILVKPLSFRVILTFTGMALWVLIQLSRLCNGGVWLGIRRHDRNTNARKLPGGLGCGLGLGDCSVLARSHCAGVGMALVVAVALGGCGSDVDTGQAWFAKPFDMGARSAGYTFSELSEAKKAQRPITPNDLVNANGSCPAPAASVAAAPAAPAPAPASGAPPGTPPDAAQAGDPSSLMGGGIALGMSECDVVFRAGQPSSVQIGNAPNGDRTAVLTFPSGPRAGMYHFLRGALTEMDGVPQAAPPPQVAKKKSTKPKKAAQN
jgi:hypothetical protein